MSNIQELELNRWELFELSEASVISIATDTSVFIWTPLDGLMSPEEGIKFKLILKS